MANIFDRFQQFRKAIVDIFEGKQVKRDLQKEALEYGAYMRTRIQANAPDGTRWVEPDDVFSERKRFPAMKSPRPSLRQHGITLRNSFTDPELGGETNLTGSHPVVEVEIGSTAPHAQVVIEGAINHIIPLNVGLRKLFFYHHKVGVIRFLAALEHPGTSKNPFVEDTYERERAYTEQRFDAFFTRTIFKPLEELIS